MKRHLLLVPLLLLCQQLACRERYAIDENWEFFTGNQITSDYAQLVSLPHTWNTDALSPRADYRRGTGNYLKRLDIPAEWQGRRVFIRFGGANSVADVLVNNRYVGTHRGGATAFAFEIGPWLRYGERNEIRVLVSNAQRMDVLPLAAEGNSYGGLWRGVELIVTEPLAVSPLHYASEGIYVTPSRVSEERAEGVVRVHLVAPPSERTAHLEMTLLGPALDTIEQREARVRIDAHAQRATASIPFAVERPRLWDGRRSEPALYRFAVKVRSASGALTDSVGVVTGLRSVTPARSGSILLNGRPYPLRGFSLAGDRAVRGGALLACDMEQDVALAQEIGANALHTAGMPFGREFYDFCDRVGMAVWSDLPLTGSPYLADHPYVASHALHENGAEQLLEMIHQLWNHPSVVMWGIFSNLPVAGDDPVPYLMRLDSLARATDPSRLTVGGSNQDGPINFVTQLIVWNQNLGWVKGDPDDVLLWREQLCGREEWRTLRSAVRYAAGGSPAHQDSLVRRPDLRRHYHPERWQTHFHERYLANLGSDTLFWGIFPGYLCDFGAARTAAAGGTGFNDCGLVSFDRSLRKDAFYLYKAAWNRDDGFVHIAERRWNRRENPLQRVKVYSNRPRVELFVNGSSLGVRTGQGGIFRWDTVALQRGSNRLEAVAVEVDRYGYERDQTVVTVAPALGAQGPRILRKTTGRPPKD